VKKKERFRFTPGTTRPVFPTGWVLIFLTKPNANHFENPIGWKNWMTPAEKLFFTFLF
jgi:hypothetical protein